MPRFLAAARRRGDAEPQELLAAAAAAGADQGVGARLVLEAFGRVRTGAAGAGGARLPDGAAAAHQARDRWWPRSMPHGGWRPARRPRPRPPCWKAIMQWSLGRRASPGLRLPAARREVPPAVVGMVAPAAFGRRWLPYPVRRRLSRWCRKKRPDTRHRRVASTRWKADAGGPPDGKGGHAGCATSGRGEIDGRARPRARRPADDGGKVGAAPDAQRRLRGCGRIVDRGRRPRNRRAAPDAERGLRGLRRRVVDRWRLIRKVAT